MITYEDGELVAKVFVATGNDKEGNFYVYEAASPEDLIKLTNYVRHGPMPGDKVEPFIEELADRSKRIMDAFADKAKRGKNG